MATLTATVDDALGKVTLSLTGVAGGVTGATISRQDPAGNVQVVRNGDPANTTSGSWSGEDFEAPLDVAMTYYAWNAVTPSATPIGTSSAVTVSSATLLAAGDNAWLGHPGKPSLNKAVLVREFKLGTRASRATTHNIIGRATPLAQSLRRSAYNGTVTLRVTGEDELADINTLLDDGQVLLMRAPASYIGWGSRYLQIGDVEYEPLTRAGTEDRYHLTMPWIEVARPAGLAQGGVGFRWVDVYNGNATFAGYAEWRDLIQANLTWAHVADGVP
jgi:hypothetical protein